MRARRGALDAAAAMRTTFDVGDNASRLAAAMLAALFSATSVSRELLARIAERKPV